MMELESKPLTVTTSNTLVSKKRSRGYFGIQNNDTANSISVKFGDDDATLLNGILVLPGEFYEINRENSQQVSAIAETAPVVCAFIEGTP